MKNVEISIKFLKPSDAQPRTSFSHEKIEELAESFREHGILQPILVRRSQKKDFYEIIAGERRFRAASMAGLTHVPCVIMDIDHRKALSVALVENIQRENLNPIEEAKAYKRLCFDLELNPHELALKVGKDRTSIINSTRLLLLPNNIQDMLVNKELSAGHARALIGLQPDDLVFMLAQKIVREGLSVRKTESLVRALKLGPQKFNKKLPKVLSNSLEAEVITKIQQALGTKTILKKEKNGYWLNLHFSSVNHLNDLLERLGIEI